MTRAKDDPYRALFDRVKELERRIRQQVTISRRNLANYLLLAGRSGGQTAYGGTASGDDLTLESTSHGTKGAVLIQPNGGDVGVRCTDPTVAFEVFQDYTSGTRGIMGSIAGDHASRPAFLILRKSRGTRASPTVISNGDLIGSIAIEAYDGDSFHRVGRIDFQSNGTVADGSVPTDVLFRSGGGFGTRDTNLAIRSNGNVEVRSDLAVGHSSPTARLHLAAGTATNAPLKFASGTDLTTPEAGALEFDGNALEFTPFTQRRAVDLSDGVIVSSTTVADTVTQTTVYTEPVAADELYKGLVVRTVLHGHYSTANASDTFTARLKVGGTTVDTVTSAAANVTNGAAEMVFQFTVRSDGASGSIIAYVSAIFDDAHADRSDTATTTIDTTVSEDITLTIQWSAADAGNTFTLTQGYTEFIGRKQA